MDGCMDDAQKLSQCSLPQPSQGSYDSFSLGTHLPFRETVLFNFNFLGLFYNYSLLGEEHRPDYRCRFIVQQIQLYPHHILSPVIVKKICPEPSISAWNESKNESCVIHMWEPHPSAFTTHCLMHPASCSSPKFTHHPPQKFSHGSSL